MAGLLTPRSATVFVGAIRKEFPDMPIHVHTHDTAGCGRRVDGRRRQGGRRHRRRRDRLDVGPHVAADGSGAPSANVTRGRRWTPTPTPRSRVLGTTYWENGRALYAPFESGQLSGSSDVYAHEIPGGQYTNLLFQSRRHSA